MTAGSGAGGPILIASFNPGKARELAALLSQSGRSAKTLRDVGIDVPYEETGATYEENGLGKARHYARLSGLVTIADDSGLEVEALGGAPGPLSARYGGPGLDDAGRNRALLAALQGVGPADRGARYVAVAVVARPDGKARAFRGEVRGRLLEAPRGGGGFGYDPLFYYEPYGATFAEVSDERKHAVSHRGAAFAALAEWLASPEGERFTCAG
ncbi:MAG TPA: RdgB/HAM1 family non-canonical purine NTP pyrophosphatase [Candidatus Polarisedimenticolia bacterium]|nr:RdgB/HAM1 family non-canonical purine NTP pyrophosphatase [Candidatus Polarisedimenticolia bacterium]